MKNLEIASIFGNMADLLEIQGANPFLGFEPTETPGQAWSR